MEDFLSKIVTLLPAIIVVAIVVLILWGINWFLLGRKRELGEGNRVTKRIIMVLLSLVGIIIVLLALPVSDTTRGQLLGFLGLLLSAIIALSSTTFVSNAMAGVMGKVSKKLLESLTMADKSIDRLSRIVTDFLDISKIESGTMKLDKAVISAQAITAEVVETLQPLSSAKEIELKTIMCKDELPINVDRDRITQVLTNLIGNALKFIPVNGHIDVHVTDQSDEVEIAVQDDGPGLSKDEMEKIFDRFVQVHNIKGAGEHGTGLGLTISKELVEMHDGRIWVDSTPGQGCCFHIMLPKYDPHKPAEIETKESISSSTDNKK